MNKKDIAQRFSRAAHTYHASANVQRVCAQRLISYLNQYFPQWKPQNVLDVGTGTGYVIDALCPLFPQTAYSLNDISPSMLEYCQHKFAHLPFTYLLGDIETLSLTHYELIISNLALQWVNHLPHTLHKLYKKSHTLAFTCLLEGTFESWYTQLESHGLPRPHYPSLSQLRHVLEEVSSGHYWLHHGTFPLRFEKGVHFMRYLQKLGATSLVCDQFYAVPRALLMLAPVQVSYHVAYCILTKV